MYAFTLLTLPLLAAAAPTLSRRAGAAGAPEKVALPADCPIKYTYPSPNNTAFAPTSQYASTMLYQYTLSPGATSPSGTNDTQAVQDCLETCYGYGNPGQCTSIWSAHGVHVEQYGSDTYVEFVCQLYSGDVASNDLGPPTQGDEDSQAHAMTIQCAARSE